MSYQAIPSNLQADQIVQNLRKSSFEKTEESINYEIAPVHAIKTLYFKTSTLLNVSGSNASGRRQLIIENLSDVPIVIGNTDCITISDTTNTGYVNINGKIIDAGAKITINLPSTDVSVYGRSTGYSADVRVEER